MRDIQEGAALHSSAGCQQQPLFPTRDSKSGSSKTLSELCHLSSGKEGCTYQRILVRLSVAWVTGVAPTIPLVPTSRVWDCLLPPHARAPPRTLSATAPILGPGHPVCFLYPPQVIPTCLTSQWLAENFFDTEGKMLPVVVCQIHGDPEVWDPAWHGLVHAQL